MIIIKQLNFGKCKKYLQQKGMNAGHYFKAIKMKLYRKQEKVRAENTDKELPLVLVIQRVLEEIKQIAIKQISMNKYRIEKIRWVVTVQAIWEEKQKHIMMKECINAELINENTDKSFFFALEPETASLYCLINKDIDRNFFKQGEYYIVCDLGGGTGDIVAHLVCSRNHLNEIYPSCGGNFGPNEIDRLF